MVRDRAAASTTAHLARSAARLLGYALLFYLVLRLVPGLKAALRDLERVSWAWVIAAALLETASETGFVASWRAIIDPGDVLAGGGRGRRTGARVAWAQLAGGILVPGGSLSGVGVGAWLLHRFGMPPRLIAERHFNLSFLNTTIDAFALVAFGVGLWAGLLAGEHHLALTLVPAALAAAGIGAAVLVARSAATYGGRLGPKHPKLAAAVLTVADAVGDTGRLVSHRSGAKSVLGALAYFGFDVLVLWSAFFAIGAHDVPSISVVAMAYIIGALGGSIPLLPAGVGTVGGISGMLILYGVAHNAAFAAVVLYEAIGLLVPLVGGGIAYLLLRRRFGPARTSASDQPGSSTSP